MKKLYSGHKIYLRKDHIYLWPLSMTQQFGCCIWHMVLSLWTFVPSLFKIHWRLKGLWTAYKIYPLKNYVKLWPLSVALTLVKRSGCCAWNIVKLFSTLMPIIFKIPWRMKRLCTGNKIYPLTDYVNLWRPTETLIFEKDDWCLRMTHRLMIVNICAK
jgi:hypothetical protein